MACIRQRIYNRPPGRRPRMTDIIELPLRADTLRYRVRRKNRNGR